MVLDDDLNCMPLPLYCPDLMQPNGSNECECRPEYVDDGTGKCVCPDSSMMFDADMNCIQIPLHCPAKGFEFFIWDRQVRP